MTSAPSEPDAAAAAFAALEAIRSGKWDRYLLSVWMAIDDRRHTDGYLTTLHTHPVRRR